MKARLLVVQRDEEMRPRIVEEQWAKLQAEARRREEEMMRLAALEDLDDSDLDQDSQSDIYIDCNVTVVSARPHKGQSLPALAIRRISKLPLSMHEIPIC